MTKYVGELARYPARNLVYWYAGLIGLGTILLWLPFSREAGTEPISLVDAGFTATSAACVTGLIVRSTPNDFSFFGELVILLWIQLGGLGIMTVATFALVQVKQREDLRQHLAAAEILGADGELSLRPLLSEVVRVTLIIEAIGALLLFPGFLRTKPFLEAVWHSLFHSVSAFCNAGFALDDASLIPYQGDVLVNGTICSLIILGGLGYPVLLELEHGTPRLGRCFSRRAWRTTWQELGLHTKLVLVGSVGFLVAGTLGIFALEAGNAFGDMPWGEKLLASFFQSVTTRTAGFNTVDLTTLSSATLLLMILWMFVGGGPCSTAGGLKVTTFCVLVLLAWHRMRGCERVGAFRRSIPGEVTQRAVALVLIFATMSVAGILGLLVTEGPTMAYHERESLFAEASFETVSALGTVGLSLGLTPELSTPGRLLLALLMFVGRIGPLTLAVILTREQVPDRRHYPAEGVLTG